MAAPALVLFDLDDVLCVSDKRVRSAHLARLAGSTTERVYAALWGSRFSAPALAGEVTPEDYLADYGRRIGYPLTLEEWLVSRKASMTPIPQVLELVARVKQVARVAVLTNNTTLVAEHIGYLFPELPALFGRDIYASAALKAAKPDAACFHACLAALQAAPAETLFIDDLAVNVAGARAAGLDAHRFTTPAALAAALARRGLL